MSGCKNCQYPIISAASRIQIQEKHCLLAKRNIRRNPSLSSWIVQVESFVVVAKHFPAIEIGASRLRASIHLTSLIRLISVLIALLLLSMGQLVCAQSPPSSQEFWPEVDVYVNIKPKVRLFFMATVSKSVEDGELFNSNAYEGQVGAHIDYLPGKHLVLRAGYRFGTSLGSNEGSNESFKEHRVVAEQTLRKIMPGDILLSDRNREDFRFISGDFSFRYRNRVTLEREFHVKERVLTPYTSAEVYYDTRFDDWSRTRFVVGVQTSLRRGPIWKLVHPKNSLVLDLYLARQHDFQSTNRVNALGAALVIYF
jgi:hypothetical protein